MIWVLGERLTLAIKLVNDTCYMPHCQWRLLFHWPTPTLFKPAKLVYHCSRHTRLSKLLVMSFIHNITFKSFSIACYNLYLKLLMKVYGLEPTICTPVTLQCPPANKKKTWCWSESSPIFLHTTLPGLPSYSNCLLLETYVKSVWVQVLRLLTEIVYIWHLSS